MKEFLEYLLKNIVANPEQIAITESKVDTFITLVISASTEDMGLIIGKEGKNIKAIRNIIKAKAIKDNVRVLVQIVDPRLEEAKPTLPTSEETSVEEEKSDN